MTMSGWHIIPCRQGRFLTDRGSRGRRKCNDSTPPPSASRIFAIRKLAFLIQAHVSDLDPMHIYVHTVRTGYGS
jgi:hypothetical protein